MSGGCCICLVDSGKQNIVVCDGHGCKVSVHKACYGISTLPKGSWFCRKCESQERAARVKCELCPQKDGALKRTDSGSWCHVVCALYIPEVTFVDNDILEPIHLKGIPSERFGKACYICEDQGQDSKAHVGVCMLCCQSGCRLSFHVTCGQAMGLLQMEKTGRFDIDYLGYCKNHNPKKKKDSRSKLEIDAVALVEKGAKPSKLVKSKPKKAVDPAKSSASSTATNSDIAAAEGLVKAALLASSSMPTRSAGRFTNANFTETIIMPSPANFGTVADAPPVPSSVASVVPLDSRKNAVVSDEKLNDAHPPNKMNSDVDSQAGVLEKRPLVRKTNTRKRKMKKTRGTLRAPAAPTVEEDSCVIDDGPLSGGPSSNVMSSNGRSSNGPSTSCPSPNGPSSKVPVCKVVSSGNHSVRDSEENSTSAANLQKQKISVDPTGSLLNNRPMQMIAPPLPSFYSYENLRQKYSRSSQDNSASLPSTFPTSMDELLERQWLQGSQLVLEHGEHFDVASLLTHLNQLRYKNQRMEHFVGVLTSRRDHLLSINSKLAARVLPSSDLSPDVHQERSLRRDQVNDEEDQ